MDKNNRKNNRKYKNKKELLKTLKQSLELKEEDIEYFIRKSVPELLPMTYYYRDCLIQFKEEKIDLIAKIETTQHKGDMLRLKTSEYEGYWSNDD